jgi:hypothetical protein
MCLRRSTARPTTRARMTRLARTAASIGALLVAVAALACPAPKAKNPDRLIGKGAERVDPTLLPKRKAADPKQPPNPPSFPLVIVPEHSIGPFLARRSGTAMGAYIGPGEGAGRRVVSLPLGADGSPLDPRVVAQVSQDATMMIVRPGGGDHGAYIAAWTALTDKGEALSVLGLSVEGQARSTPVELTRTPDDIVWVEIVPTPRGEVVVWAEETRGGDGNLFAATLEPDGRPRGLPSAIVHGVVGWQTVPTPNGAGVAMLTRRSTDATKTTTSISWLRLDADARPLGPPLAVGSSTQRVVDVDVASVGDRVGTPSRP